MEDQGYFVRGPLALVLRISRLHGVAPLKFKPSSRGYYVQNSSIMARCSILFLIFIDILIFIGLVLDLFNLGTRKAVRVHSISSLVIWLVDIVLMLIITSLGVYQGPYRMTRMIQHLKQIDKVNRRLKNHKGLPNDRWITFGIVGITLVLYIIIGLDFGYYVLFAIHEGKRMLVVCIYGCQYFKNIMALLLHLQIALVIFLSKSGLKVINDRLRDLITVLDLKMKNSTFPMISSTNITQEYLFHRRVLQIEQNVYKRSNIRFDVNFSAENSIREIADCYVVICNVVTNINEGNGTILIMLYISIISYLVVTNYYLIAAVCSQIGFMRTFNIALQFVWCIHHCAKILLLIEPCHRTHAEMEETKVLVSQLTHRMTPPGQPLPADLETFQKLLVLYNPTYSPLNIFTLNRSQIAAIIAGVTTYLLIIVQQRLIEECG